MHSESEWLLCIGVYQYFTWIFPNLYCFISEQEKISQMSVFLPQDPLKSISTHSNWHWLLEAYITQKQQASSRCHGCCVTDNPHCSALFNATLYHKLEMQKIQLLPWVSAVTTHFKGINQECNVNSSLNCRFYKVNRKHVAVVSYDL